MKQAKGLEGLEVHMRAGPGATNTSYFGNASRIGIAELRNAIVSRTNDPSSAPVLANRVLIERVMNIVHYDPLAIVFACETISGSHSSGALYGVTKFEVEVTGSMVQEVEALLKKMKRLGMPQPLKLLLRGGIYTPRPTDESDIAFRLSFEDGIAFKFGFLEEMSFGTEPSLLSAIVCNGPPQALGIVRDPIPSSLLPTTENPGPSTTARPQHSSLLPESPSTDTAFLHTEPSLFLDTPLPSSSREASSLQQLSEITSNRGRPPFPPIPLSDNAMEVEASGAERAKDIVMGSPPTVPQTTPQNPHTILDTPSLESHSGPLQTPLVGDQSHSLSPCENAGFPDRGLDQQRRDGRSSNLGRPLASEGDVSGLGIRTETFDAQPQSLTKTGGTAPPLTSYADETPAESLESGARAVDPPAPGHGTKEPVHQQVDQNLVFKEEHAADNRNMPLYFEGQEATVAPRAGPAPANVADPKRIVVHGPASVPPSAPVRVGATAPRNQPPTIASTSRRAKNGKRPKQYQPPVPGPPNKITGPVQNNSRKRYRKRNKRGKGQQESGDVNVGAAAEREPEVAPAQPTESNIAPSVDVPKPPPANATNDVPTQDEDEQKDQVIEEHFKCVAKMMPPELAVGKYGYSPVGGFKDNASQTWMVNMVGVIWRVDSIFLSLDHHAAEGSQTFRQTINIRDETPGNLSFTLFAEDRRNDWLPGLKLQLGHSILIRGIKPTDQSLSRGTGYSHKWSWVAYNPETKTFYSAADEPPSANCQVHECSECARHSQGSEWSNDEAPFRFSPVHVPSDIEKAYLVTLADWWKKEQGTVHMMVARPPKERRIADINAENIPLSQYKRIFANVIVEVIATTPLRTSTTQEVYVTDYTVHHELYGGRGLAQILTDKQFDDLDAALDLARGHRLLLITFFDGFADMAEKMRTGQFYRLRNLAVLRNLYGNLEGRVKVYKALETKDVQLLSSNAQDEEDFAAFLKRREEYMESAQRPTKLAFRLEEPEASLAAEAVAVEEPPRTQEKAAPEPNPSQPPSPTRRLRVLDVYASNENRQRVERQPALPKSTLPALRHGESIWDRQVEADSQTSAEQDETKVVPPTGLPRAGPDSASPAKKDGCVQVLLEPETKRAPRASSIAEMHDALDKYKDVLAFRFVARVVDYYPDNCSDFVELACASCDARFEKTQKRCKFHSNDEAIRRWSFQLMFEDHNGDRLSAFVIEPHASEFFRDAAPSKRETVILNNLVGKYWMPALAGNLREWRQKGGADMPGNQRIHGNFHEFCVVSSLAVINGKERHAWHLVKTKLEVHNPLLDELTERQPQRIQLINKTTARLF